MLDLAEEVLRLGHIDPELARRFGMMRSLDAQRGVVDCGMGLCGKRGRTLGRSLPDITCPECLVLLGRMAVA